MIAALDRIAKETERLGYRSDAIVRDYPFSALTTPGEPTTRRAPLAVFTQTPPSYRSAAFGAAEVQQNGAEVLVRSFRDLGAPLFFVVEAEMVSVWQVYADGPPRLIERASLDAIDRLFEARRGTWNPDSIHRAKSIGRFNSAYQLDFVDIGLMPAIEGQIHEKLDRLLNETLAATRDAGVADDDKAMFQGVFRLVAAKILTDREHRASTTWNKYDVRSVLAAIGSFYGLTDPFPAGVVGGKLSAAWDILRAGLNVSNISADDLAFVYENTLVTPETRRIYGTHSTPRHVAEYVVGRLDLWRDAIEPPKIYEPFAGAGVFLVSALRHLREGLPHNWTDRQRHDLLVKRIKGSEIDAFACEVAVLSLILADYPNKNGWKIENIDLFKDHNLSTRLAEADVVLCNPPFEIFNSDERVLYPEVSAISGARAEADGNGRKERGEQIGAGLGQLVENEIAAADLREDREQARAGRGLQHPVGGRERCGGQGRQTERDRRRELLKGLRLLGPARVGRQQPGDLGQRGEPCSRRCGFAEKRLSVLAQKQDGRRFAGVVGRFPVPGAAGVGGAEGLFHGGAQNRGIDHAALFEMRKEIACGGEDCGGRRRVGRERKRRRRSGSGDGSVKHGGYLERAEDGRAGPTLSLDRTGSNPSRPTSHSGAVGTRPNAPAPLAEMGRLASIGGLA